ncbi:MAG: ThiF family adenylyltransferase [Myxococcota bacterium]
MSTAPDRAVHETHFWVIGAGGLGCPALLGLLSAGARRITIIDHDRVERHNLQRQVLFSSADVGALKAEAAAHALRRREPRLQVQARVQRLDPESLAGVVEHAGSAAVVLECTDAPALKFAANDAALRSGTSVVIAAALGWQGQALAVHRAEACYRCIYESPPPAAAVTTCAEAGVLGAAVGMVGFLAAHLAAGVAGGQNGCGQLHRVDLLSGSARAARPTIRAGCPGPHAPRPSAVIGMPAQLP